MNKLLYGSFASCALGLFFVLVGSSVTFSILGSFGLWIAIVNAAYLGYLILAIRRDTIAKNKNILMIVHGYCLSGITLTCTLGLGAESFGYMTLVGSILTLFGDTVLCFLLFSDEPLKLATTKKAPRSINRPKANPSEVIEVDKRDTIMTDFSEYSNGPDSKRQTIEYENASTSANGKSKIMVEEGEKRAIAKYDYDGNVEDPSELVFKKGDKILVTPTDKNWWVAMDSQGNRGIVPANYMIIK